MKKNLRIVSAAAAALLAVAPVAASAVSVNADVVTNLGNLGSVAENAQVKVSQSKVVLNAANATAGTNNSLTGSIVASVNGQSVTGNLDAATNVTLEGDNVPAGTKLADAKLKAKSTYTVSIGSVSFNVGAANANKSLTVALPSNITASNITSSNNSVKVDQNGYLTLSNVVLKNVNAYDLTNASAIFFASVASGTTSTPVTTGSIEMSANSGKLNVNAVVSAAAAKYDAYQNVNDNKSISAIGIDTSASVSNLEDALKAANVPVDTNGFFDAPKSFTFNLASKSNLNAATQTLSVTVNVPNGKDMTVPSQSKTIRHNAYFYDKDAKRVGTDKLTRYNSVTVAMSTTKIGDKTYYEVVENGKATGKFINADNIDGTKRTLKHNAYVYKSSKKRANKVVLKKGEEVTTYGGTYTFKNGKQYYKIGDNTHKTYVKASNF